MKLSRRSIEALKKLFNASDGLPFDDLGICNDKFLYLLENKLIKEPEGVISSNLVEPFAAHEGKVLITEKGRAELEYIRSEKARITSEWIRWSITSAIAIAAFLKSFFF